MDVNRLLGDELTYELWIRGLPIGNTVAQKRIALRDVLYTERQNPLVSAVNNAESVHEFPICERKLTELKTDIDNFNIGNRDNDYRRISSRLIHLSLRLNRLHPNTNDDEITKLNLSNECARLIGKLNLVYQGIGVDAALLQREDEGTRSILDEDNPPLQNPISPREGGTVAYDLVDVSTSSPNHRPEVTTAAQFFEQQNMVMAETVNNLPPIFNRMTVSEPPYIREFEDTNAPNGPGYERFMRRRDMSPRVSFPVGNSMTVADNYPYTNRLTSFPQREGFIDKPLHVSRWNVRFNGKSSVTDFLERIEELRLSRGVTKDQLLRSAPELFTHEALLWYRTSTFSSWDKLIEQLKEAFRPADYEYALMDEIRRRTQGSQEKVITYVAVMESLFRKLSHPLPEEMRINYVRRNLLPHIQTQLSIHPLRSMAELVKLSRSVEDTQARVQKYQPPPTNTRNLLEPELAYKRGPVQTSSLPVSPVLTNTHSSCRLSSDTPEHGSPQITSIPIAAVRAPKCFNCKSESHKFKECDQPRKRFCFKCGLENVILPNCPNCQKNGKGSR